MLNLARVVQCMMSNSVAIVLNMRGSRKFCQGWSNFDNVFFYYFYNYFFIIFYFLFLFFYLMKG